MTPTPPPNAGEPVAYELTGKQWSRGTSVFLNYVSKFTNAKTYEEAMAIGDVAAQEIYNAIIRAIDPYPDPYPWLARGAIPPYQPPFPG